ncbi:MAG: polysaccharide biosynthesis/export family protein [Bacteroidia bacterium]|nr:polysaccharide biosynthesis/export family protein [Bacteroidia bacterium]
MRIKTTLWSFALLLLLSLNACVSYEGLVLMRDVHTGRDTTVVYEHTPAVDHRVRPYDQLLINVNSYNENTAAYINNAGASGVGGGGGMVQASLYVSSYIVNDSGYIHMPIVGAVKVAGLTTGQIKDTLDRRLAPFVSLASASVKLTTFQVTVLGEVLRPGTQFLFNGKTNILQVVGLCGDFTDFSDRTRVKIVRETDKGSTVGVIDVTKPDFFTSPYFFVQPNDVIYVEPLKAKAANANLRIASIGLSISSVALTVVNILLSARN